MCYICACNQENQNQQTFDHYAQNPVSYNTALRAEQTTLLDPMASGPLTDNAEALVWGVSWSGDFGYEATVTYTFSIAALDDE
ncbi:MAG: hypothetical protein MRY32_09845, partial [Rickettsiales bacterium]|nr:hypothetical protein [Rickettsiales bacterium]